MTDHEGLAPGYKAILAVHRFFNRGARYDRAGLQARRSAVSRWVSNFTLPPQPGACESLVGPSCNIFRPTSGSSGAHIFFLHGGGLVFYSVRDYSSIMAHIAVAANSTVTAFEYKHAPEHTVDEIIDTLCEAIEQRSSQIPRSEALILAGDSMGAYLAAYLAIHRYPWRFSRLAMINPVLITAAQSPSYSLYGNGLILTAADMSWYQRLCRTGHYLPAFDLLTLSDAQLASLPAILLLSAEFDVLRDEAFEWAKYLRNRGNALVHEHFPTLAHDFLLYSGAVPEARSALDSLCNHLSNSQ